MSSDTEDQKAISELNPRMTRSNNDRGDNRNGYNKQRSLIKAFIYHSTVNLTFM